jgi:tetratricopeptide (TPR) repeat protein
MKRTHGCAAWCLGLGLLSALPSYAKEPPATPAPPPERPAERRAEPPPADLTEQAKQLYLLGAEAFAAQRNADAIYYFRQAERLVPSAKLTYNIALAYDEMGDTGRALREYRAFLVREPSSVHREEAQSRSAKLELALAALGIQQLRVASDPPGATLRVEDEVLGVTPWAGELTPGLHHLRLERAGYRVHETQVTLSAQHAADVEVTLQQPAQEAKAPSALARIAPLSWGFLGVGVGALAGGLGFELSRASSSDRAGRASSAEAAARAQGAADAKQMASLLLLGAGGAFVIGGGVLLVLDLERDPNGVPAAGSSHSARDKGSAASVRLPCSRDFCGVLSEGRF